MQLSLFASFVLSALLVLLSCPFLLYAQEPLAIITQVDGEVWVKNDTTSSWQKAIIGKRLQAGDSVRAGKNVRAIILYKNSTILTVDYNRPHLVRMPAQDGEPSWWKRLWNYVSSLDSLEEKLTGPGGSRGEGVVLLFPRAGKVLNSHPVIAWTSPDKHKTYQVLIYQAKSHKLIWEMSSQDSVVLYPRTAPKLQENEEYRLHLMPRGKFFPEDKGLFRLATSKEIKNMRSLQKEIKRQYTSTDSLNITAHILLAATFLQNEYYTEAYQEIRQTLIKQPKAGALKIMLLDWYRAVGLSDMIPTLRQRLAL
jgi:hypothetical protein